MARIPGVAILDVRRPDDAFFDAALAGAPRAASSNKSTAPTCSAPPAHSTEGKSPLDPKSTVRTLTQRIAGRGA